MTDLDLDAIEARANAATDGPWGYPFAGKNRITTPVDIDITEADWGGENLREYVLSCLDDRNAWRAADAEFIAHARTDVPALVAALREARAEALEEVRSLREANESLGGMVEWQAEVIIDTRDALRVGGCTEHVLTAEQAGALEAATRILNRERNADPSRYDLDAIAAAERDDWRRRYEGLRDGVTGLCDDPMSDWTALMGPCEKHTAQSGFMRKDDLRAVVARVEGDGSA